MKITLFRIAPPAVIFCVCISNIYTVLADELDSAQDVEQLPTFVTAARMVSSYSDSPNSLTRLNTADLFLLGIDNIVDSLRMVPGFIVSDLHGSNSVVGYHGSNVNVPRRMEILYNSISQYRPGYADLHWWRMPIKIEDLNHIEVVRGSATTDFGSNAFTAAVNFVQKPAILYPAFSAQNTVGSGDTINSRVEHRLIWDSGHYYFRAFQQRNDGFDSTPNNDGYDDSSESSGVLLSGELNILNNTFLDWSIANSQTDYSVPLFSEVEASNSSTERALRSVLAGDATYEESTTGTLKLNGSSYIGKKPIEWHSAYNYTKFQREQPIDICIGQFAYDPLLEKLDNSPSVHLSPADFDATLATGIPQLNHSIIGPLSLADQFTILQIGQKFFSLGADAVLTPICGTTDQNVDETRQGVEFQSNLFLNANTTISSTVSYNHFNAESNTYLNGTVKRSTFFVSNNFRYEISPKWITNTGIMFEYDNTFESTLTSYRMSLGYRLTPQSTIRLAYSKSNRSPDIYESNRVWNYQVTFLNGQLDYNGQSEATLFRNSISNELEEETIKSTELAYTHADPLNNVVWDIKLFYEDLDNLISEPFEYLDFNLSNNGEAKLTGLETGYQYQSRSIPGLRAGASYMYLVNDTDTPEEKTLYSRHSGSAWVIIPVSENTNLGVVYFGNDEIATRNYSRVDIALTNEISFGSTNWILQLKYRHYPEEIRSFTEFSNSSANITRYDNNDRIFFTIKIDF